RLLVFLYPPQPPCSTLFPYTTLFRSLCHVFVGSALAGFGPATGGPHRIYDDFAGAAFPRPRPPRLRRRRRPVALLAPGPAPTPRSEEHTSELQSRRDLVCRLLLEKKK